MAPRTLSILFVALDHDSKLDETPQNKKQKIATGLLRDKLYEQDFAGPISVRASKVLGPMSLYRVADTLPHIKLVSRASRPGLTLLAFFASIATGYARLRDFTLKSMNLRTVLDARVEPDSLPPSLITTSVPGCTIYTDFLLGTCYSTSTEKPSTA